MHSAYNQRQLKLNRLKIFFFEKTSKCISEIAKAYVITKYDEPEKCNIEFTKKDALNQT